MAARAAPTLGGHRRRVHPLDTAPRDAVNDLDSSIAALDKPGCICFGCGNGGKGGTHHLPLHTNPVHRTLGFRTPSKWCPSHVAHPRLSARTRRGRDEGAVLSRLLPCPEGAPELAPLARQF